MNRKSGAINRKHDQAVRHKKVPDLEDQHSESKQSIINIVRKPSAVEDESKSLKDIV